MSQDLLKPSIRDVHSRFNVKDFSSLMQDRIDLTEEFRDVFDLVRHPEYQDKIHRLFDADVVL